MSKIEASALHLRALIDVAVQLAQTEAPNGMPKAGAGTDAQDQLRAVLLAAQRECESFQESVCG